MNHFLKINPLVFSFILQRWCFDKNINYKEFSSFEKKLSDQLLKLKQDKDKDNDKNVKEKIHKNNKIQCIINNLYLFQEQKNNYNFPYKINKYFDDYLWLYHIKDIGEIKKLLINYLEQKSLFNNLLNENLSDLSKKNSLSVYNIISAVNKNKAFVLSSSETFNKLCLNIKGNDIPNIIFIDYKNIWQNNLPYWLIETISLKEKYSFQIWIKVNPNAKLDIEKYYKFSQIGWSWYLDSPVKKEDFALLFNNNKNLIKYWLSHNSNDQWVFPISDIVNYEINNLCGSNTTNKYWHKNRFKKEWESFDNLVFEQFKKSLGGEGVLINTLCFTYIYLEIIYQYFIKEY